MNDPWDHPDAKAWIADVSEHLVPLIDSSELSVSICPTDPADIDIKFSVELGVSIMLDKPIITVVRPGTKVPEHLIRVSDRIVEIDIEQEGSSEKLAAAIHQAIDDIGKEGHRDEDA